MNVGKAVYGILSSTTAVTDIVSTNIFPEIAEQETATPFIVYQLQGVSPEDTHDGPSKLDEVRMEIICFSDSYNGAADLADKVRGALDRVSGTYNGVNVESVQFNNVDIEIEYDPRRYSQVTTYTFRIKRDDITIAAGTPVTGAQLGDLSDVNTTGVTDNQVIAYDANTQVWLPAAQGGVTSLNGLSDVTLSGLLTGQTLIYNHDGSPRGFFNGNQSLEDLTDTSISNPSNQSFLRYVNNVWIAEPVAIPSPPPTNTDGLPEGTSNEYFTEARVAANSAVVSNTAKVGLIAGGTTGQALVKASGTDYDTEWADIAIDTQYHNRFQTDAETFRSGATETVELYYTAKADGDGLAESASSDTPTAGKTINRKIYYSETAFADPDTGTWVEFTPAPADDATFAVVKAALLEYLKARTGGTVPISLKQTWEEVAEPTDLLDTYTGAAAGYSLRRIKSTETVAIRVRRSSDNTEQDIGFSAGELDTSSLLTFAGAGDAFVKTWYDQSGNSNDATQTSTANQPKIVSSGAVITENGKPAVEFDGSATYFPLSYSGLDISSLTVNTVCRSNDNSLNRMQFTLGTDTNVRFWNYYQSGFSRFYYGPGSPRLEYGAADTNQHLFSFIAGSTSGAARMFKDSTEASTSLTLSSGAMNTTQMRLGAYHNNAIVWSGTMQEFIVYSADQTDNRTGIETNVNTFYNIF